MSSVDTRVVEMQFDNKRFEKGVEQSTESIQNLKKNLDFSKTEQSLQSFGKTANAFNLSSVSDALQIVSDRFSILGVAADQIIRTITNKVMGLTFAVVRLINSFTVGPIMTGWNAFAEQTSAVQRIISSGYGMDDAEAVVEKLSWYTDETSYNMTDMVNNLGKFTSAGVELSLSEQAIIGVANACGSAGIGAEGASHAMEGFAKAIAAGKMTSQNWSWIRTARLNTEEFGNALIQAGKDAKVLKEVNGKVLTVKGNMEVTAANIDSTLSTGWMNTEVMISALGEYGRFTNELYQTHLETGKEATELLSEMGTNMDDISEKGFRMSQEAKTFGEVVEATRVAVASQWAKTFKLIFGNYEEAKVLWTRMSNELWGVFAGPISEMNDVLAEWHNLDDGGYKDFIESIKNIWEGLKGFVIPIKEAMEEIKPPITTEQLQKYVQHIHNFSEKLKNLFSIIDVSAISIKNARTDAEEFDRVMQRIAHNKQVEERLDHIRNILKIITAPVAIIKNFLNAIWRTIKPLISSAGELGTTILNAGESLGLWLDNLRQTIEDNDSFYNFFQKLINFFKGLITASDGSRLSVGGFIEKLKEFKPVELIMRGIAEAKEKIQANGGLGKILGDAAASGWNFIKTWADKIIGKIKDVWPTIIDAIKEVDLNKALTMGGIAGAAKIGWDVVWSISEIFRSLKGLLTGGFNLSDMFSQITDTLWDLQTKIESQVVRNIAVSVAILAGSMLALSMVPTNKLFDLVGVIAALSTIMVVAMNSLRGMGIAASGKKSIVGQLGDILLGRGPGKQLSNMFAINKLLRGLAISILLLAGSVWIISKAGDGAIVGMIAIIVMMTALVETVKRLDKNIVGAEAAAKVMKKLATSIVILSVAVRILAVLDPVQLMMGVLAVGALIFALGAFITNVAPALEKFGGKGLSSVLSISIALFILSSVAKRFGEMEWSELGKAGAAIGALLLALGLFTRFSTGTYDPSASAASVLIISAAMLIMAGVIKTLSKLSWEGLAKGMAVVVVSLAAFAGAVALMKLALGEEGGGMAIAAILALALAMQMLLPVFVGFSLIKWGDLFKPIAAVAAALGIFALAAWALQPLFIPMAALSGILALLGISMVLIGAGLAIFNTELAVFAASAAVNVIAIIGFLKALIYGLDEIIPALMGFLGHLVAALITGIGEMIVPIGIAVVDLLIKLLQVIGKLLGPLVVQLVKFIIQIINALAEAIRTVGEEGLFPAVKNLLSAIIELILSFLGDLLRMIPGIGDKIGDALDKAKDSVHEYLVDDPITVDVDVSANTSLPEDTNVTIGVDVDAPEEIISSEEISSQGEAAGETFGLSFVNGFGDMTSGENSLFDMSTMFGADENGESAFNVFSGNYLGSFETSVGEAKTAGGDLAKATLEGMNEYNEQFATKGTELVTSYKDAMVSDLAPVETSGGEVGAAAVVGATSQTSAAYQIGVNFAKGLGDGMYGLSDYVAGMAGKLMTGAINKAREVAELHSPSKVAIGIGSNFGIGLAIGMDKMADTVALSGGDLAGSAINSMNIVLEELSDRLNGEMISDPVISPVLDLTNIQNGMAELDNMFGNRPWIPNSFGNIVVPNDARMIYDDLSNKNQNGTQPIINVNVTTQELSNSTVDYLVRRVNSVLGGKI